MAEAGAVLSAVLRQFDLARRLVDHHLNGLEPDEILWRPASKGLHVWPADPCWHIDWPETETHDIGPPSIAWLGWHMGFWLTMATDHQFGSGTCRRETVDFPGAEALPGWLGGLMDQWRTAVSGLDETTLLAPGMSRWPFADRSPADLCLWANAELMKGAAEIGYARFLYAVSRPGLAVAHNP